MRAWLGGAAAVALVGAAAWLLLSGTDEGHDASGDGGDGGSAEEASAPAEAAGAGLARSTSVPGARAEGPRSGAGAIVGVVRRGGAPAAARVEATFLAEPYAEWARGSRLEDFYRRMLTPSASSVVVAAANAGADGRFALEGLGPGAYRVAARAGDGARGGVLATIPVDGVRVEANPVLSAGTDTLRGRVVHADGRPWTGLVMVEPSAEMFDRLTMDVAAAPLAVDEAGRFTAEGVGPDPVTVTALEPGVFRASSRPVALPRSDELVLVVDASLQTLAGKVVADADGSPVGGARVFGSVEGTDFASAMRATTAGADGSFRVDVPGRGRATLVVSADGYATTWWTGADPAAPIEVRLSREARLAGRVVSATDGAPVPGLVVRASSLGGQSYAPSPAETGPDGRYEIGGLGPGEAMAVAEGGGWVTRGQPAAASRGYNPLAVTLEAGKTATLDLVVERGAQAVGRVVDASGAGVAGALVRAVPGGVGSRPVVSRSSGPGERVAVSGPDGAFSLDGLVPDGSYMFAANAPERAQVQAGPIVVAASPPTEVELRFGACRWVDVTVVDGVTGAPIPGVRVLSTLESSPGAWGGDGVPAVTDGTGVARAGPFPPVSVRFMVTDPVFIQAQGSVVPPAETAATLRLQRGLPLVGRVVLPDGAPAAYASVRVDHDGSRGWWVMPTTADADGVFRLERLGEGTYQVRATAEREGRLLEASARAAPGGEEVTLRLGSGGSSSATVALRVLDPEGRLVPRATANVSSSRGSRGGQVLDGRATFEVSNMGTGDLTVAVWGARRADGTPLPLAPYRGGVVPGEGVVTVRLEADARIEGRVVDAAGKGLRGVGVTAEWPPGSGGQRQGGAVSSARTADDGSFRLGGLGPEEVLLRVQLPPDFSPVEPLPARGGASGVEIQARAGVRPTIVLLDWRGAPVAGAHVNFGEPRREGEMPPGGWSGPVQTSAAGTARLSALAPDRRYTLLVARPADRLDVAPLTVPAWAPRDETFRLARAWFVRGVVRDRTGQPIPDAMVTRKGDGGGWNGTGVDPEGRFTFTDIAPGDVTLRAQVGHDMREGAPGEGRRTEVVVPAGTDGVVLTVDPGPILLVRVEGFSASGGWAQAFVRSTTSQGTISMSKQVSEDGTARFFGLRDEAHTLFVGPFGGKSALRRGVRPGGEVRVSLEPGRSITGRLVLPAEAEHTGVSARFEGFVHVQGVVQRDGRYEIAGLVEGTWTVSAGAQAGGKHWTAEAEVAAGGTIDLELKAR